MQVVKGTVVGGKVVLNQGCFPEGAEVAVFITQQDNAVCLPPVLQQELESLRV